MNHIMRRDLGLAYIADREVAAQMQKTRKLLFKLNHTDFDDLSEIAEIAEQLLGQSEAPVITPPFYCDYGSHIHVGKYFFANYNCTIVDVAQVTIGENCLLGPNVSIFTAGHPVHPATRDTFYEYGKEVTIGDHVWIGGSTVICPGVHVGSNVVIGAGSVVTRDVPDWCVAAGNPCRVIRPITEEDKKMLFHREEIDAEAWQDILRIWAEKEEA